MLRVILASSLLSLVLAVPAAAEIFRVDDPRGDDFGAGDLVYPNRDDFEPRSLDLEFLSARATRDGTWFKARMGRPIVSPAGRLTSIGSEPLEAIARNGFYTFNIDVYIDTDRVAGSGRTDTLPGRLVNVHRESAWEKAVILTPRPQVARAWFAIHLSEVQQNELRAEKGRVDRDDVADIETRVEEQIAAQFHFPDRVRVRGREIEFFVPADFLGGTASPEWAYTVLVTGADVEQATKVLSISPGAFSLMAMQVGRGRATDRFGIIQQGDINQPPVIDILAPSVEAQQRALSDYDVVAPRLAAIPGVSPAGREAVAGPARPPAAAPATGLAPPPTEAAPAGAEPGRRTIPSRLRTLNALREEGLISEEEYQQLRRKILAEI
jgi:hypothetical protein